MRSYFAVIITFLFLTLGSLNNPLHSQIFVDIESGMVKASYNDARIPGSSGTMFSFTDELMSKSQPFIRIRGGYEVLPRHTISLLYAPLKTVSTGMLTEDLMFMDEIFLAETELEASYKFNSYRFTYRYDLFKSDNFEFGLGLTGKIRDARISVSDTDKSAEKIDLGFVPLINFRLNYKPNDSFGILLEGDALGVNLGRAEDIVIAGTYKFSDNIKLKAGYRILEGGADTGDVYTFAMFHYALIGFIFEF